MDILKIILVSALSAVSLFIIAKLMGHKQISQLDFFDYITGITIGSIAAELATELESPWKPLIAMAVYGAISVLLSVMTIKLPRSRKFINGTPTIIMNNGKLCRENMKKAKLDLSEFMIMCRQEGYFNISDIQTAVFECNGRLTILPYSKKRPLTPCDMGVAVPDASIPTEVIMDGRILDANLKRLGLDTVWLENELKLQKYNSAKDVFLGLCDRNNKLTLFPAGTQPEKRQREF